MRVIIEKGKKRVFASALDWPGWARHARSEADALDALVAYGPRYAKVVARITPKFVAPKDTSTLTVAERIGGNATTDFGAPSGIASDDTQRLTPSQLAHLIAILEACWSSFDRAARAAAGKTLRTGPRGGGRSVVKMHEHVLEAQVMYLSALGSRAPKVTGAKRDAAVRHAVVEALTARAQGKPIADPSKSTKLWSPRFFARRSAWHALDHAWELEDRATP